MRGPPFMGYLCMGARYGGKPTALRTAPQKAARPMCIRRFHEKRRHTSPACGPMMCFMALHGLVRISMAANMEYMPLGMAGELHQYARERSLFLGKRFSRIIERVPTPYPFPAFRSLSPQPAFFLPAVPHANRDGVFFFREGCGMAKAATRRTVPPSGMGKPRMGRIRHPAHRYPPGFLFPVPAPGPAKKVSSSRGAFLFPPCPEGIAPHPCLYAVNAPPTQIRRGSFFRMGPRRIKKQMFIMDCIALSRGKRKLQCAFTKRK